jgi:hypothetical protein
VPEADRPGVESTPSPILPPHLDSSQLTSLWSSHPQYKTCRKEEQARVRAARNPTNGFKW